MNFSKFIWAKLGFAKKIPGMYKLYKWLMNVIYPDGKVLVIKNGPLTGFLWKRYRCHQAWMAMGMYEPHVSEIISSVLKPGDVFYDIGANAGYFSLLGAKLVNPEGIVVAFDPVPINVNTISENISINNFSNVCKVVSFAVSDRSGEMELIIPKVNANSHLAVFDAPNVKESGMAIKVSSITLDEFSLSNPIPALIKMDIEGAEVAALNGAFEMLHKHHPTLLISTHSVELDKEVKEIIYSHGYDLNNIDDFEQMIFASYKKNHEKRQI